MQAFAQAMERIDAVNRQDPRTEVVDGQPQPREWLFANRVYDWVQKLTPNPSEELLLAARGHTIRRWMIPREQYPKTTVGYHQWRGALAEFHAKEVEAILREVGYAPDIIEHVRAFITRSNWPANREACVLEDADCLVFLETKLPDYLDEWGDEKTVRILERTIEKMTPDAQKRALELSLSDRERTLVRRAAGLPDAR